MKLDEVGEREFFEGLGTFRAQDGNFSGIVPAARGPLVKIRRPVFVAQVTKRGIGDEPLSIQLEETPIIAALQDLFLLQREDPPEKGQLKLKDRLIIDRIQSIQAGPL